MAGISSKAAGKLENKNKLFGKELQHGEFSDGSGLEWYDYGMRDYDQQIGRFFRIDPISEKFYYLSPYQYCSNNPIKNVDLDGAEGLDFRIYNSLVQNTIQNPNGSSAKVLGTIVGIGNSVQGAVYGGMHPIESAKGLGQILAQGPMASGAQGAANAAIQYSSGGEAFTNYAMGAHVATDILMEVSPFKGAFGGKSRAVAKIGISEGKTVAAEGAKMNFTLVDKEGDLAIYSTKVGNEVIKFGGDFTKTDGILTIKNFDVEGSSSNQLGGNIIKQIMKEFGKMQDVNKVVVEGKRTTGAKPGKTTNLNFDVNN